MFEGMIKHTGVINNTGKNVVVVFMSLPDDPEHALVIDTDALPDTFNESLRKIVESTDGQQAENLADVLARRMSPDGSNMTLLQKFHGAGRLQRVSIDLVTMTPRRGVNWPLRQILEAMRNQKQEDPVGFDDLDPETRAQVAAEIGKFNVHASNSAGETAAGKKAEAANLIKMAEILEADASQKRQQAYRIDPSLMRSNKSKTVHKIDAGDLPPTNAVALVKEAQVKAAAKKPAAKKSTAKKSAAKTTA
jgi:hypothetical protein